MGKASNLPTEVDETMVSNMLSIGSAEASTDSLEVCSAGLPWLIARTNSLAALECAVPNQPLIEEICRENKATGLTVYMEEALIDNCSVHVGSFAPEMGIGEYPACGSGNGAVAVHRSTHSMRGVESFSYRAEQGLEIARKEILSLSVEHNNSDELKISLGAML
jgi:PhzF family phenazine biosynthesis protein